MSLYHVRINRSEDSSCRCNGYQPEPITVITKHTMSETTDATAREDGDETAQEPTRFVLVSGFLGAGKTTSMKAIGEELTRQGHRVGMITNDQASGLVDTSILDDAGGQVEEISGGCFCCKFGDLMEAAESVLEQGVDVLLCEPVGSCTDLVATVINPLRSMHEEQFSIAPLTVILDPSRVRALVMDDEESNFPDEVRYIFRLQVEEADVVVLNKKDTLEPDEAEQLVAALEDRVGDRPVLPVSAREGDGVEDWTSMLMSDLQSESQALTDIDYDTYAEGEAKLGWLNLALDLQGSFNTNRFRERLMNRVQPTLRETDIQVAHLKFSISTGDSLSWANLTSTNGDPGFGGEDIGEVDEARLVFNARAVGDPEDIQTIAIDAIKETAAEVDIDATIEEVRSFRPEYPQPVHRMDDEDAQSEQNTKERLKEFNSAIEKISQEYS